MDGYNKKKIDSLTDMPAYIQCNKYYFDLEHIYSHNFMWKGHIFAHFCSANVSVLAQKCKNVTFLEKLLHRYSFYNNVHNKCKIVQIL